MVTIELTEIEGRIIGCLMEKSVVTPDQYPMTLNALTNACNQKSARNPVIPLHAPWQASCESTNTPTSKLTRSGRPTAVISSPCSAVRGWQRAMRR
jgi:hypothetical protein